MSNTSHDKEVNSTERMKGINEFCEADGMKKGWKRWNRFVDENTRRKQRRLSVIF